MKTSKTSFEIMSGSILKLVAISSMFIDHFALMFFDTLDCLMAPMFTLFGRSITLYFILRKIGRLAFPLFCFLISEGVYHTKNPKKYAFLLLIFALISEIPFNLMLSGKVIFTQKQNVYFTLLLGVLLILLLKSNIKNVVKLLLCVLVMVATHYLGVDFGINGVLLICLLYAMRDKKLYRTICAYPLLSGGYAAWCGILLTTFYNGERGFIKNNIFKYVFYSFYPLHIVILFAIKTLICN